MRGIARRKDSSLATMLLCGGMLLLCICYYTESRRRLERLLRERTEELDRRVEQLSGKLNDQTQRVRRLTRMLGQPVETPPEPCKASTAAAEMFTGPAAANFGAVCRVAAGGAEQLARQYGPEGLPQHRMAVLLPYRDREQHLNVILPQLSRYLEAQGRAFDIFVIEQSKRLRFNRGALLNAGALLLQGSDYDYLVFHDVDTIPLAAGGVQYDFPAGRAPLHLTPPGIHPVVRYEDFFGGISAFSWEQLRAVNGYGTNFWGWGREDDNMRERLQRAGRWPPQRPRVGERPANEPVFRRYFRHQQHEKAAEVRVKSVDGGVQYVEEHPDSPYGDALIVSAQPDVFSDTATGLNTTRFWLKSVQPLGVAVKFTVELFCDTTSVPWCEQ